jgi:hypothetical protein
MSHDTSVQVGDDGNERGRHHLDPDHIAGSAVEVEQHRRSPAGRLHDPLFVNQTLLDQLECQVRYRRGAEPRHSGDLGS